MYASDEALAADLLAASPGGHGSGLAHAARRGVRRALKSNFADMANIGGRAGGSVTAAKFLQRFATKYPWAHLDIAGTSTVRVRRRGQPVRPVPLLTHFVLGRAASGKA
jgi:leucyl aminopeptidase